MTQAIQPSLLRELVSQETMYRPEFNQDGTAKHSRHCMATFARRDWDCHRCVELLMGAAPRNGWQREYFARKLRQNQRSLMFPE
jgi:hypothetical protein